MDCRPHGTTSTTIKVTLQDATPDSLVPSFLGVADKKQSCSTQPCSTQRPLARSTKPATPTANKLKLTTAIGNRIGSVPPRPTLAKRNATATTPTTPTTTTTTATLGPNAPTFPSPPSVVSTTSRTARPAAPRSIHPPPPPPPPSSISPTARKTVTSLPPPPRPPVQTRKRSTSTTSSTLTQAAAASGGLAGGAAGEAHRTRGLTRQVAASVSRTSIAPGPTATATAATTATTTVTKTGVARQRAVTAVAPSTSLPLAQLRLVAPTQRNPPRRPDSHVTVVATATTTTTRPQKTPAPSSPTVTTHIVPAASTTAIVLPTENTTTMAPVPEKPRPPLLAKPAQLPRLAGPLTPKVSSARPVLKASSSTPARRGGTAPTLRPGTVLGGGGGGGAPDGGRGTPPPSTPREDYITPTISATLNSDPQRSSVSLDSKFFYARDARSPPSQTPSSRPASLLLPKSTVFPQGARTDHRPPHNEAQTSNQADAKFVYANGTPDMPTPAATSPASSGSFSRFTTGQGAFPRPGSPARHLAQMQGLRPSAPLLSSRSQVGTLGGSLVSKKKVSTEGVARKGIHSRSGSIETAVATRVTSSTLPWPSGPSTPESPSISQFQPAMTMASILHAAEEFSENESDTASRASQQHGEAQSPSKSSHPGAGGGEVNELVANARRERKVQDLQITNASLEAINRTLERQLKKQTTELRRFKRLSRSGRLSAATSGGSTLTVPAEAGLGLSVVSEDGDPDLDGGSADLSLSDDEDGSDLTPSEDETDGKLERSARRRKRDQDRLQLDMSKHHQLLADSQRMNQSLKRCLDWTEELIREGQKALAYSIRLGEVEATGHRLALNHLTSDGERHTTRDGDGDDDDADDGKSRDFDGTDAMSDAQCTEEWIGEVRSELPKWSEKAQQDRDSGVDLPPDGG